MYLSRNPLFHYIFSFAGASFSSAFVTYVADRLGWRHSMLPIFIVCLVVSILVLSFLHSKIRKRPNATMEQEKSDSSGIVDLLFSINGVPSIALSVFFLKFARYALVMWLPMYLTKGKFPELV